LRSVYILKLVSVSGCTHSSFLQDTTWIQSTMILSRHWSLSYSSCSWTLKDIWSLSNLILYSISFFLKSYHILSLFASAVSSFLGSRLWSSVLSSLDWVVLLVNILMILNINHTWPLIFFCSTECGSSLLCQWIFFLWALFKWRVHLFLEHSFKSWNFIFKIINFLISFTCWLRTFYIQVIHHIDITVHHEVTLVLVIFFIKMLGLVSLILVCHKFIHLWLIRLSFHMFRLSSRHL